LLFLTLQKTTGMFLKALRESSARTQIVFTAIVILICGITFIIVGFLAGWLIFGLSFQEMQLALTDLTSGEGITILKYFQVIQSIGLFIVPPLIVAWFLHGKPGEYLRYNNIPVLKSILLVIAIVYFSEPLINWLNEIISKLQLPQSFSGIQKWMEESEQQANRITQAFLKTSSFSGLLFNIFMIGLLPAIGEELLFRGIVQQLFKKWLGNAHAAIWISAALFSALHLQFFGFLPRLLLGAMFGYMLEWSGSLLLPMIAHFINNATAVVAFYLLDKGLISKDIDKVGTSSDGSTYMVLLSIFFLYIFFRSLYLQYQDNQTTKTFW
jgi:membrane protease YdiL (CAAX protease family)